MSVDHVPDDPNVKFLLDTRGIIIACSTGGDSLGLDSGGLIGKPYAELMVPGHAGGAHGGGVPEAGSSCRCTDGHVRLVLQDGSHLHAHVHVDPLLSSDGEVHGSLLTVSKIGLYETAKKLLRESDRRFRVFANSVSDHAICMLDPEGRVLDWNLGAQRMTGFYSEEIVGRHFSSFFPAGLGSSELPARLLRQAKKAGRAEIECHLLRSDREDFPAKVVLEAIQESDGNLLGFAKIIRDLTQKQQIERHLHEIREQFAHTQKIEALGQLTGGIAHDFNNALQGIISSLEVALLGFDRDTPAPAQRYIEMALEAAIRAGRLTRQLLGLAHRQTPPDQPIEVQEVVQSVRELLERTLGDGVALKTSAAEGMPFLACDGSQLESALVNLAINARDAMNGKGQVTIAARTCTPDEARAAAKLELVQATYVEIQVSDNGPGMSDDTHAKAMEPFFTTKPKGHGTGLGLTMVHGFVTQYGGGMNIQSVLGQGTTVSLYLPGCDDPDAAPNTSPSNLADLEGFRVLVVEDNDTVRRSIASRLQQLGCEVQETSSSNEALTLLTTGDPCDLLLTDIDLPGMDGYELSHQARTRLPLLRVILMTGYADGAMPAFEVASDDTEVLVKPFDMGALVNKARMLLKPCD